MGQHRYHSPINWALKGQNHVKKRLK